MDPIKSKTDFQRPDRETTAQGAPPHERAAAGASASAKEADDRAHGFSQDSGYASSGGNPEAGGPERERKSGAEGRRGQILSRGPHDDRPGATVPNLNSVSESEIAQVDFVGASLATAIVALRDKLGSFHS